MIPVEPVSLSIGIAALFTTCIQCFEYFKAATTVRKDFDILLLKLELEQERLLIWGEAIGIGDKDWSENLMFNGDGIRQDLARRCLNTIKNLLEDAESLKSMYGLQLTAATSRTVSHHSISSNALKRLRVRLARSSNGLGVLEKTRWAIYDAAKFQKLIGHLRDLIDGLMRDTPGSQDTQDEKVQDDIASMADDILGLRLFSEACGDIYPKWSDTARSAIDASETGTIDGYLANGRLERYQDDNDENALGDARHTKVLPTWFGDDKIYLSTKLQIFFVLTEQCRNEGTDSPCDQTNLGPMSFANKHCFVQQGAHDTGSSPGHWIAKDIDPREFTIIDLEQCAETYRALQAYAIDQGEIDFPIESPFLVKLYIYCPPCACQIATAIDICRALNKSRYLDVRIRVDHHQPTSCSLSSSRIDGLASLIDHIKRQEDYSSHIKSHKAGLKAMDRQWLEQIIYDYEEEVHITTPSPANRLSHIVRPHKDEGLCAAIIILGEADYCIPFVGAPPFPPIKSGRMPQETQLYRLTQGHDRALPLVNWHWQRHYMGTYSQKKPLTKKRPVHMMLDTEADGYESEIKAQPNLGT